MTTEIVMVLDESGSMDSLAKDIIGSYNNFLDEQVKNEVDANISVVAFSNEKKWIDRDSFITKARRLSEDTYRPNGCTALNDAIGAAYHVLEYKNPDKAIVVIITDGAENASKEINHSAVKPMIEAMKKREWQVLFLAANQDAFKVGATMGVNRHNSANFNSQDPLAMARAFRGISGQTLSYASTGTKGSNESLQNQLDSFVTSN